MQIIQWLLKMPQEQLTEATPSSRIMLTFEDVMKERDKTECEKVDMACKDPFTILLARANSKTCFSGALNLKNIRTSSMKRDCLHLVKGDLRKDHSVEGHSGSKVIPICDATSSQPPQTGFSSDGSANMGKRALCRVKELLTWAAAAKSDKGRNKRWKILYFQNKRALQAPFDETSSSSSKISCRWDVGSCSTSSSAFSPLSLPFSPSILQTSAKQQSHECRDKEACSSTTKNVKMGNWITTDSEFVVLEL